MNKDNDEIGLVSDEYWMAGGHWEEVIHEYLWAIKRF
jgi:hypothetical protein